MNQGEEEYLNLVRSILLRNERRDDRTGTGTLNVFGSHLRFSLSNGTIPLITTKYVFFRGIVEELLFFLRGDHDARKLSEKNVYIWDGHTSREYLDRSGLQHLETNDLGLAYGVQWRAAGAKLNNIDYNYIGHGVDQLSEVIRMIKTEPHSRRIIMNAWNVTDIKNMALPPCHVLYQFDVSSDKKLNCIMFQRSADVFLGLPFNIASTALLTHILARVTNLEPGEIIISIGNAHIYFNHIEQMEEQLKRKPFPSFPMIRINKKLETVEDIERLKFEDFQLINYQFHPTIKGSMAI